MPHICVSKLNIIGSDNGLVPDWCQGIIWTNTRILLIKLLRTKFSDKLIKFHTFSFKKLHLKMSSAKSWPFRLGLKVLTEANEMWLRTETSVMPTPADQRKLRTTGKYLAPCPLSIYIQLMISKLMFLINVFHLLVCFINIHYWQQPRISYLSNNSTCLSPCLKNICA